MINIKTESHGMSPSFPLTPIDTPRIAFVEPLRGRQPVPVREGGLLTVPASDLSLEAVRGDWLNRLLAWGGTVLQLGKDSRSQALNRPGGIPQLPAVADGREGDFSLLRRDTTRWLQSVDHQLRVREEPLSNDGPVAGCVPEREGTAGAC